MKFEKSSANGAYTNPTATLGIKWPIGWIWCHSMPRGMETHNPLRNSEEGSRRGTKKQPVTANDMKPEKEETYAMNPESHGRRQHRGRTRGLQGTKQQQNIENDMNMQIGLRRGPRPGGRVRCRFRVKHMILRTRTCRVPFSTQIIGSQICRWLLLQHPEYCPFPETHIATCFLC